MPDQLKSFMIGLGFQIDQQGMAKIEAFAKSSEAFARQMTASVDKLTKSIEAQTKVTTQHAQSHNKMREAWDLGKKAAIGFTGALTTLAITGEEAVRRVSKQFETLFYLSQRTGVSATALETLRFQYEKIGLSAGQADSAVAGLASRIRSSPGILHQIQGLVGPVNDASDAIQKLAQRYARVLAMGAPGQEAAERSILESLGLVPDEILQVAQNIDRTTAAATRFKEILQRLGYGDGAAALKKLQDNSLSFRDQWYDFQFISNKFWQGFANSLMPSATRLLGVFNRSVGNISEGFDGLERAAKDFLDELIGPDGKKGEEWLKGLINQIREFFTELKKPDPKGFAKDVRDIGDAIRWLIDQFIWLKKEIGLIPTLLIAAFAPTLVKGIIFALGGQIVTAFTGLGTAAGGAFSAAFLAAVGPFVASAFAAWQLWKHGTGQPGSFTDPKNPQFFDPTFPEGWENMGPGKTAPTPPAPTPPTTTPGPRSSVSGSVPATPVSYRPTAAEGPDDLTTYIQALAANFANWWSGSAAYNPIVQLAQDFYDKIDALLHQLLEDFGFEQKATGPGGVPGSAPGGAPGGEGAPGGGARPGGRFAGMGPGGGTAQGEGGKPGEAPNIAKGNYRNQAIDYFVSQGWTREQAAGIAANLETESNWRKDVVGDAGKAFGLGQWHPDRQAKFKEVYGKDIRESTFGEQLAFVNWELNNTEKKTAGDRLRKATSAREAGAVVSQYYERPRDVQGNRSLRGSLAEKIQTQYSPSGTQMPAQAPAGAPVPTGKGQGGYPFPIRGISKMFPALPADSTNAPESGPGFTPEGKRGIFDKYGNPIDPGKIPLPRGGGAFPWNVPTTMTIPQANLGAEKRVPTPVSIQGGDIGQGASNGSGEVIHKSETTISVVGAADPHGTAEAVRRIQDRHSPLLFRNRKAAIV